MNISDAISKMNTEVFKKKLSMISNMLTPEQQKQMENVIRNFDKGEFKEQLNSISEGTLKAELEKNPQLAKNLASNPELMNKLSEILKKK